MGIIDELELQTLEARRTLDDAKLGLKIMADAGENVTAQRARLREAERRLLKVEQSLTKARREER